MVITRKRTMPGNVRSIGHTEDLLRSRCGYCGQKSYRKFMEQLKYSRTWLCSYHLKRN